MIPAQDQIGLTVKSVKLIFIFINQIVMTPALMGIGEIKQLRNVNFVILIVKHVKVV